MNLSEEKLLLLALWLLPGMGPVSFFKLYQRTKDPEAIFALSKEELIELGLKAPLIEALKNPKAALKKAKQETENLKALGASLITFQEETYPPLLLEISDPPPVLFFKGELALGPYSLAVVGSRAVTSYGRRVTQEWVKELSLAGLDIISGLALGVDRLAHEAALKAGGYTLAVLGCGLDRVYPFENRPLAQEIVRSGGALVTEFPLGTPPKAQNFPIRNRLISGLSRGVLVIEAGLKSGSLITARLAAEQGREVMAVPGSIYSGRSHGTHYLIREGALLVDKPSQVLEALGLEVKMASFQENLSVNSLTLSPEEANVLKHLEVYPMHVDDLAYKMGLEVSLVSSILLSLELKGLVESQPGNFYQKVVKR